MLQAGLRAPAREQSCDRLGHHHARLDVAVRIAGTDQMVIQPEKRNRAVRQVERAVQRRKRVVIDRQHHDASETTLGVVQRACGRDDIARGNTAEYWRTDQQAIGTATGDLTGNGRVVMQVDPLCPGTVDSLHHHAFRIGDDGIDAVSARHRPAGQREVFGIGSIEVLRGAQRAVDGIEPAGDLGFQRQREVRRIALGLLGLMREIVDCQQCDDDPQRSDRDPGDSRERPIERNNGARQVSQPSERRRRIHSRQQTVLPQRDRGTPTPSVVMDARRGEKQEFITIGAAAVAGSR